MRLRSSFAVTIISVALIPVGLYLFTTPYDWKHPELSRVFPDTRLKVTSIIEIEFNAVTIKYFDGTTSVYNFDGGQIVNLNSQGQIGSVIGSIEDGLGKFRIISDYSISKDTFYVIDLRNRSYSKGLIGDSSMLDYHTLPNYFSRSLILDGDQYVLSVLDSEKLNLNFRLFSNNSNNVKNINTPYERYDDGGFGSDGFFIMGTDYFAHVCYHVSNFSLFNLDGTLRGTGTTLENYFDPPTVIEDDGHRYLSTQSRTLNLDGCGDDTFIYILSNTPVQSMDNEPGTALDIYDRRSLRYSGSYLIPPMDGLRPSSITRCPGGFLAIHGKKIVKYDEIQL